MSALDTGYFREKLTLIVRDLSHYTPQEMARELVRLAKVADEAEAAKEAEAALSQINATATPPAAPVAESFGLNVEMTEKGAHVRIYNDSGTLLLDEFHDSPPTALEVEPPRVPTEAMLNAARDWSVKKYNIGIGKDAAIGCWQAMHDAACAKEHHGHN